MDDSELQPNDALDDDLEDEDRDEDEDLDDEDLDEDDPEDEDDVRDPDDLDEDRPGGDDLEDEPVEDDEGDLDEGDEAEHATVASAATVDTAKRLAIEGLRKIVPGVDEADVEFVVLEEGSKGGFFGRGRVEAQVEARLRPSAVVAAVSDEGPPPGAEALRAFVQGVVDRMGIEAAVSAHETPEAIHADISGDDLGILIGRHGTTIDALQYVAAIAVNGDRRHRRQVVVDAEGYRVRREASLKALADRSAQKAARESSSVQLKPMTAAERKVIHLHLKDHPRVETVSEGQEPFRAVIITPRPRRA
jgi:spoIIIJ-associated protein